MTTYLLVLQFQLDITPFLIFGGQLSWCILMAFTSQLGIGVQHKMILFKLLYFRALNLIALIKLQFLMDGPL